MTHPELVVEPSLPRILLHRKGARPQQARASGYTINGSINWPEVTNDERCSPVLFLPAGDLITQGFRGISREAQVHPFRRALSPSGTLLSDISLQTSPPPSLTGSPFHIPAMPSLAQRRSSSQADPSCQRWRQSPFGPPSSAARATTRSPCPTP